MHTYFIHIRAQLFFYAVTVRKSGSYISPTYVFNNENGRVAKGLGTIYIVSKTTVV